MTTYMIDSGDGNWLANGGQDIDRARALAQREANERGEAVTLYESPMPMDDDGDACGYSEQVEPTTVQCACGAWSGERCQWSGPMSETVVVEYMPEHLRGSHAAAGNRGSCPGNGARRIRVESSCADRMIEHDGDWCEIVEPADR